MSNERDDLVERLKRKGPLDGEKSNHTFRRMNLEGVEAAARIEALQAERDALAAQIKCVVPLTAQGLVRRALELKTKAEKRAETAEAERDAAVLAEREACERAVWRAWTKTTNLGDVGNACHDAILARSNKQENTPDFEGFTRAIMEEWQEHGDIEASEKFDLALKFNILKPVPGGFDPEIHECPDGISEPGDPWYELNYEGKPLT